jgi:DNA gyrase inhibitor GyrI
MTFRVPPWAADAIVFAFQVALPSKPRTSSAWSGTRGRRPKTTREKHRALARIASEQGITPIRDFEKLALDDPDEVPLEEFISFIRATRRGGTASG